MEINHIAYGKMDGGCMTAEFTENAVDVLNKRYLIKNENGEVAETIEDLFRRVARSIAAADAIYDEKADIAANEEEFYELMTSLRFLPNSPTLFNAGRSIGQLSACFVLPVEDNIIGIFEAIKNAAIIHQSGGGTGFSFSRLRAKGTKVNSTGGKSSGPVSFMTVFNAETEVVRQGGNRRGANIGILRVDHPDIEDFINCKIDSNAITNFNISVGITDLFMSALLKNEDYDIIDPINGQKLSRKNSKMIFNKIVAAAWDNGEPGIVFLDKLNEDNIVDGVEFEATNPCGEQPLLPYESCNLGSINLMKCMRIVEDNYILDENILEHTVKQAVHFLDNVIDVNKFPLEIIEKNTKKTRKIGLGIMGLADALICMSIPYDSAEGIQFGKKVMALVNCFAHKASEILAEKRGAFPDFEKSRYRGKTPLRNGTLTTIAPTGTLSIIAGCSSGVEPIYACSYTREIDGEKRLFTHPMLHTVLQKQGLLSDAIEKKIKQEGSIRGIEEIPESIRRIFVCAHDISPEYHVRMQAALQENVDNAVSKTVNFPATATESDFTEVFLMSYRLGCKGITTYRDKSRKGQVLNAGYTNDCSKQMFGGFTPRKRAPIVAGYTERAKTSCGNLYITINYDEQGVFEVFTNTSKDGGCHSQSQATARLISTSLRSGVSIHEIYDQLKGIRCPATVSKGLYCASCPDAIAKVLLNTYNFVREHGLHNVCQTPAHIEKCSAVTSINRTPHKYFQNKCPECGEAIQHEGNCVICRHCYFSRCGSTF